MIYDDEDRLHIDRFVACELNVSAANQFVCDMCDEAIATKLLAGDVDMGFSRLSRLIVCEDCCDEIRKRSEEEGGDPNEFEEDNGLEGFEEPMD